MTLTFFTNLVHHHQIPLADEFFKRLGHNYRYVAMENLPECAIIGGYDPSIDRAYILRKCYVKTLVFSLPISFREFISVYEDINKRFVYENWKIRSSKKPRKLNIFIAFCMNTNMFIGSTLRRIYNILNR